MRAAPVSRAAEANASAAHIQRTRSENLARCHRWSATGR